MKQTRKKFSRLILISPPIKIKKNLSLGDRSEGVTRIVFSKISKIKGGCIQNDDKSATQGDY